MYFFLCETYVLPTPRSVNLKTEQMKYIDNLTAKWYFSEFLIALVHSLVSCVLNGLINSCLRDREPGSHRICPKYLSEKQCRPKISFPVASDQGLHRLLIQKFSGISTDSTMVFIRTTYLFKYIENFTTQKNENFHMKILIFFIFLLKT